MNWFKSVLNRLAFWRRKEPSVSAYLDLIEQHRSFSSSPKFVEYSRKIWQQSCNGHIPAEMGFTIDMNGEFQLSTFTNENKKLTLSIIPGKTKAIVHTHPNSSSPKPSTPKTSENGKGDTGIADAFKLDIYVVSSRGLWVYDHQSQKILQLHNSIDWLLT